MLFTDLKISKQFLRYSRSKSEPTIGSLWEAQTKTAKIDYFTKNLSSPTFFEITTLNFKETFLAIFKEFCSKEFLKNRKIKIYSKLKVEKYDCTLG